MTADAARIADEARSRILAAADLEALHELETTYLGKQSELGALKASMRDLDPDQRKELGAAMNRARTEMESALADRRQQLADAARIEKLAAERLDLTEFLGKARVGHDHVITQTWERLEDVFCGMGFSVADGPEVETDWFNFEALNLPKSHPARSLWDTLYLDSDGLEGVGDERLLLRTHTSPVQIRTMLRAVREESGPPIYVVCPGRVYRRDTADATHLPVFHQIEGLVIDRHITLGDLAGTIESFVKAYFGDEMTSRLRPSYFPFTEPSAEFDISTPQGGWLEVGGCGMIHPNVLRAGGLDPDEWSGFAFGFGIDRLAKIRYQVGDLREFVANDIRFLSQF
ncbi:MAG TPA: phenylalanine--tRNA ligase subunit alpha [Microthrixaceae bacterium]|nr:phenylalanine--tRNA ligase subunit alpha [Microthrixaceae bacterium]